MDLPSISVGDLLIRCLEKNDAAAWDEFVRRFHRTISGAVYKLVRSYGPAPDTLVEDLVQDTFLRLCADRCRALREFTATDEACFYGFLRATALSAVHDHFRRRQAAKRRGEDSAKVLDSPLCASLSGPEPERDYHNSLALERIDRQLLAGDLATAPRNRLVFWLHYRDGYSAAEIARIPAVGLTAKGVETLLRRLKESILELGRAAGGGE